MADDETDYGEEIQTEEFKYECKSGLFYVYWNAANNFMCMEL